MRESPFIAVRDCLPWPQASQLAQSVKNVPAMQETWVPSLGWDDPLEEGMAIHSSVLAWRIPMDRGAWWAAVHGISKCWTQLKDYTHPDPMPLAYMVPTPAPWLMAKMLSFWNLNSDHGSETVPHFFSPLFSSPVCPNVSLDSSDWAFSSWPHACLKMHSLSLLPWTLIRFRSISFSLPLAVLEDPWDLTCVI